MSLVLYAYIMYRTQIFKLQQLLYVFSRKIYLAIMYICSYIIYNMIKWPLLWFTFTYREQDPSETLII